MPRFIDSLLAAAALAGGALIALRRGHPRRIADVAAAAALAVLGARRLGARGRQPALTPEIERTLRAHALLVESLETNPLPFALYDAGDRLVTWNRAYEEVHSAAFAQLRRHLADHEIHYADLVRITAQGTLPPAELEQHVASRVARQRAAHGEGVDREYPGLGWLRVTKFITRSGAVAGFAMDINELKQREAELEREIERGKVLEGQLRVVANTDALTDLANRRCFFERAEAEFRRSRRYGDGLCAIMMDIDHFKQVNDTHGHGVGDKVLVGVAQAINTQLRQGIDLPGRLGGEEFGVLLPHVGLDSARCCAERIRMAVEACCFDTPAVRFRVSVSLGVAELDATDIDVGALLHRADRALYDAKQGGRNRTVVVSADAAAEVRRPATG